MKFIRASFIAAALALTASAQDVEFGAHGGLSIPTGDLSSQLDGRMGLAVGGHAGIYYGNGHELRPRVDYMFFQGGWHPDRTAPLGFSKSKITQLGLGADWVYYMNTTPQGMFMVMGLAMQHWTVSEEAQPTQRKTSLGLAIGAGHRVNRNIALEGRYMLGNYQSTNGQAGALQAIASLRF